MLTNLSAWLSGVWFDLNLVGGTFKKIANLFPFVHAEELEKALFNGNMNEIGVHVWIILFYGAITLIVATTCFLRQMKRL